MVIKALIAGIFVSSFSAIIIIWYIVVLIAEGLSIAEAESFVLLTSQSACDICSLIQYVWLGIGIIIGHKFAYMPPRWSSFFHSTFELVALPHYLVIGLNRATAVIMPMRMSSFWSKRVNIIVVLIMWITIPTANLLMHLDAKDDEGDFRIPLTMEFRYGPYNSSLRTHHALFFFSQSMVFVFMTSSVIIYAIAIICCFKNFRVLQRDSVQSLRSYTLSVEARLTITCVGNFLPATVVFVCSLMCIHLWNYEYLILTTLSIIDNGINSILLPMFSGLVKKKLRTILCFWADVIPKRQVSNVVVGGGDLRCARINADNLSNDIAENGNMWALYRTSQPQPCDRDIGLQSPISPTRLSRSVSSGSILPISLHRATSKIDSKPFSVTNVLNHSSLKIRPLMPSYNLKLQS
ncbi:hypothetical protein Tcan_04462 [Toxocara canis]|uniref:G-protein coupled receptors family 1 profile domain-containing protein n=1 Tax=Toxocara canis TaxID=6265 RepID=A0A0B2VCU4_TOXCA|nr:hypothetical protein Tcan_04462 [Toxocara canis]